MSAGAILFCPFCRECFEGLATCPDHDLALVPFEALPKVKQEVAPLQDTDLVSPIEFRYGRGIVALGALIVLGGFLLPLGYLVGTEIIEITPYWLASARKPSMWGVPIVAAFVLVILGQRRTLARMRAVRVAIMLLGAFILISLGSAIYGLYFAAAHQPDGNEPMQAELGTATYVIALGALLVMFGGYRLGVLKVDAHLPHGAGPDEEGPGIRTEAADRAPKSKRKRNP